MSLICKNAETSKTAVIDGFSYKYLYPVIYRLSYQFDLEMGNNKPFLLPDLVLKSFYKEINPEFSYLLTTCYKEPDQKLMAERPGLFEKFYYNERWFIVNYTTSGLGRLMYIINLRLKFIKEILDNRGQLILCVTTEDD